MQRGISSRTKRIDSKSKTKNDKVKVSKSKHKRLIQTPNIYNYPNNKSSTLASSPLIIKQTETDKQNCDVLQRAIKIVSAAAYSKQKKILTSLVTQVEKQRKLKSSLMQRQSISEITQLQKLIAYLKEQQQKEIKNLKNEIGRRKLQNFDQQDLKQNIMNLNSHVMKRSLKQTINAKNKGVDLIRQISNKFDEQDKTITHLMNSSSSTQKAGNRLKLSKEKEQQRMHQNRKRKSQTVCQSMVMEVRKKDKQDREVIKKGNQSQLIHKLLQVQKQNLRLRKQIRKIQQQFECLVEQKLVLQGKLDRMHTEQKQRQKSRTNKKPMKQVSIHQGREQKVLKINQVRHKQNCNNRINRQYLKTTNSIPKLLIQSVESPFSDKSGQANSYSNLFGKISEKHVQSGKGSSDQSFSLDKLQSLLTQKQFEINKYLKTISNLNDEKTGLSKQVGVLRENLRRQQRTSMKMREQVMKIILYTQSLRQQHQIVRNQVRNRQAELFSWVYGHIHASFFQYMQQDQLKWQQWRQHMNNQNKRKDLLLAEHKTQVQGLREMIRQIEEETQMLGRQLQNKTRQISQSQEQNKLQKRELLQRITTAELILQNQKLQSQQNVSNLRSSIESLDAHNRTLLQTKDKQIQLLKDIIRDKQLQLECLTKELDNLQGKMRQLEHISCKWRQEYAHAVQVQNQKQQQMHELQTKGEKIQQLQTQNMLLQRAVLKLEQQCQQTKQRLERVVFQGEDRRNQMIEQCGMLIQGKNQEILSIRLLVEREKMQREDLQSHFRQAEENYSKQMLHGVSEKSRQLAWCMSVMQEIKHIRIQCLYLKQTIRQLTPYFIYMSSLISKNIESDSVKCRTCPTNMSSVQNVTIYSYVPSKKSTLTHIISEIQEIVDSCQPLKLNIDMQYRQKTDQQRLKQLKNTIFSVISELQQKEARLEKQFLLKFEQVKYQKKISAEDKCKEESNNIEALSLHEQKQPSMESSSFLKQFKPALSAKLLFQNQISLAELTRQSGIVEQIQALRNELEQSFRRNTILEEELKLYQQKDIDKIFDF